MGAIMVIEVLILGGYAKLKPVRVSLPLVPCLVDEWPGKYALPEPPLTGPEGRPEPRRHPRKRSHHEARLTVKHRLTRRARLTRREWQEHCRDLDRGAQLDQARHVAIVAEMLFRDGIGRALFGAGEQHRGGEPRDQAAGPMDGARFGKRAQIIEDGTFNLPPQKADVG